MGEGKRELTRLLGAGDRAALDGFVYDELHRMADRRMAPERREHTLQATALVHEAYLRLFEREDAAWSDRRQFYSAAAAAMRRILIEHARRVNRDKRGGSAQRVTLGAEDAALELDFVQVAGLNDALDRLEAEDERAAAVTRLRFLVGLSVEETAQALSISARSVHRNWTFARARLFQMLDG